MNNLPTPLSENESVLRFIDNLASVKRIELAILDCYLKNHSDFFEHYCKGVTGEIFSNYPMYDCMDHSITLNGKSVSYCLNVLPWESFDTFSYINLDMGDEIPTRRVIPHSIFHRRDRFGKLVATINFGMTNFSNVQDKAVESKKLKNKCIAISKCLLNLYIKAGDEDKHMFGTFIKLTTDAVKGRTLAVKFDHICTKALEIDAGTVATAKAARNQVKALDRERIAAAKALAVAEHEARSHTLDIPIREESEVAKEVAKEARNPEIKANAFLIAKRNAEKQVAINKAIELRIAKRKAENQATSNEVNNTEVNFPSFPDSKNRAISVQTANYQTPIVTNAIVQESNNPGSIAFVAKRQRV